jgi:hypothetical protein
MQLEGKETKKRRQQKEIALPQDEDPDFFGPFMQVPRTRALTPTRHGPARRGERVRVCGLLLLLTLDLRKWRGLPYLSMTTSTSTSKVVLKSYHIPSCSHEWAFEIY